MQEVFDSEHPLLMVLFCRIEVWVQISLEQVHVDPVPGGCRGNEVLTLSPCVNLLLKLGDQSICSVVVTLITATEMSFMGHTKVSPRSVSCLAMFKG